MTERLHEFKPVYECFFQRAFGDLSIFLSVITFIFWNIFSISMQVNWLIILLIDATLCLSFIRIPIRYIYYISWLTISIEDRFIKIQLYKFDKAIKEDKFSIENIVVKIVDHWFYRRPIFELRLYSNGKCIYKQRETQNWKIESFMEIKNIIAELQKNNPAK